jgi:hypothetical protein
MAFNYIDANLAAKLISTDKNFKIIVISDTHIGGRTGYLPSGCKHERGENHLQTIHQETMEKNLLLELKNVGQVDLVITLGDMIDGRNAKAGGMDIGNVNTDVQIEWAMLFAKSVLDILKPKYVLGLSGSDYHVETILDRSFLHRVSLHYTNMDVFFGENLKFILGDKLWYLAHRFIEGASKGGTLERYWNKLCTKTFGRERTPDIIGYGHVHQAQNPYQIKNGPNPVYGFVCPSQKVPDAFCSKGSMGTFWEIGFMYLEQKGTRLTGEYVNTYEYWNIEQ